jgi:hypothetical protein
LVRPIYERETPKHKGEIPMRIYTYRQGSNQYLKKQKSHALEVCTVIGLSLYAFSVIGFSVPKLAHETNESFLRQFTFGQFPSVAFAVETKIAGVSAEMKEPTVENVVAEIARVFGPHGKKVVKQALDISMCESGWNDKAYNFNTNKTGDYNLFQVNSLWTKVFGTLYQHNWIENIRVAHEIYLRSHNFNAWVCAKKLGIK